MLIMVNDHIISLNSEPAVHEPESAKAAGSVVTMVWDELNPKVEEEIKCTAVQ